jgi:uncharacterized protein (DUF736 family)
MPLEIIQMEEDDGQWHENDLNQLQRGETLMDMKDNELTLWKNDSENPKAPPYKGKGLVDGKAKAVSLWRNTSKKGDIYLKLKIEEPYVAMGDSQKGRPIRDEIPF